MQPYKIPFWKRIPLVRFFFFFVCGILVQHYAAFSFSTILISLCLSLIGSSLFYWLPLYRRFQYRHWHFIMICQFVLSVGFLLTWKEDVRNMKDWFGNNLNNSQGILIKLSNPIEQKSNYYKLTADVVSVIYPTKNMICFGKILVNIKITPQSIMLKCGDVLLVSKKPQPIINYGNPLFFDFKRYNQTQQIYYQLYLNSNEYCFLYHEEYNFFKRFENNIRNKIICLFKSSIKNTDERGIAEALFIGYKTDLNKDVLNAYVRSGVVHIIAISGLHLGLIYVFLVWIFSKIPIINKKVFFQSLMILIILWSFTLLAGASASVLRSAVMFSLIIMGKLSKRNTTIHQSLVGSATILLLYNPNFLWDIGFQLSYLAIMGIITIQKPLLSFFSPKSFVVKKIWEMTSITIAAQIFTFPVCIYYFHQFPNYFLLSNLFAVPISTGILIEEVLFIGFFWIHDIQKYGGFIIEKSIWFLNQFIIRVDQLPYSTMKQLTISLPTLTLLYALIIYISFIDKKRLQKSKYVIMVLIGLFITSIRLDAVSKRINKKMLVYQSNKKSHIELSIGDEYYSFIDTAISKNDSKIVASLDHSQALFNQKAVNMSRDILTVSSNCWIINNKSILLVDRLIFFKTIKKKITINYLIISYFNSSSLKNILSILHPSMIIMQANLNNEELRLYKDYCIMNNIEFYAVREKGSLAIDL